MDYFNISNSYKYDMRLISDILNKYPSDYKIG